MRFPSISVRARISLAACAVVASAGWTAVPASAAPTATNQAGTATFTDPDGAVDGLSVTLNQVQGASVDPQGWNVAFFQFAPEVVPGSGCQPGLVGVLCPFGASSPSGINVDLGGGDDQVTLEVTESAAATPAAITLAGGAGNDRISTIRAKATLDGGAGDDVLLPDEIRPIVAAPGATPGGVIRGGAGQDTVAYETSPEAVNVSLDGIANDGRAGEKDNVATDVEHITGPAKGSVLTGGTADNTLTGGAGNDTLDGLAGDDTLSGNAGNDEFNAVDGVGDDTVTCGDGDDLVFADFGDTVEAGVCETVAWAPALSSKSLRYKNGRIRIGLKCPATAEGCLGTVILRTKAAKPATIAKARYAIKRGKKTTVSLKATKAGRTALKKKAITATALIALDGGPAPIGPSIKIRR